jgi:Kef-type K+ transport system membrane component KefB
VKDLSRWPLLAAASGFVGLGIGLDVSDTAGVILAVSAFTLGAAALGAFLHSEGTRTGYRTPADRIPDDTPNGTHGTGHDPDTRP